jgi:hypothetical protein
MSLGTVLEACIALYAALILAELFVRKQWLRFVLQAVVLLFVIGIALLDESSRLSTWSCHFLYPQ